MVLNAAISFVSSAGSAPSFRLCFFSYQAVKERKLVGSNPSCAPTFAGCISILTAGCASALIDRETDAPTNGKVLSSVTVELAFLP
ncbi:uncharacterized protein LY89DRAFT_265419 [Mollisia scopiformis]|uniref:Uncharacterized protein n=1 Tax=Mollisia scopiformis TaxID=149040 RepID=A0A132BD09_MOLSC|nr:uncharacterized protein LY89DRAFT_265419 [Mollisia scopiformis]KUJ09879.1 hypothetical protein LY89DRAFT_265419 [Mollisia scopiformis]